MGALDCSDRPRAIDPLSQVTITPRKFGMDYHIWYPAPEEVQSLDRLAVPDRTDYEAVYPQPVAPMEEPIIAARRIKVCFTLQEYEEAKQCEARGDELIFLDDPEFDQKDADLVLPVRPPSRWACPTRPRVGRWGRVINNG